MSHRCWPQLLVGLAGALGSSACGARSAQPSRAESQRAATPTTATTPVDEARQTVMAFCSVLFSPLLNPRCAKEISAQEAKAASGYRLTLVDDQILRAERIRLAGAAGEPDELDHYVYEYSGKRLVRAVDYAVAGYIRKEVKFGSDGRRATLWDGEGRRQPLEETEVYSIGLTRGERGTITDLTYFDAHGAPTTTTDGVYRHHLVTDLRGFPIAEQAFDLDGNRMETDDGEFSREATFDDWGHALEYAFFDRELQPIAIRKGYHAQRFSYDKLHRRRVIAYFGVRRAPARSSISGCQFESRMYDKRTGYVESDTCGDANGELRNFNDGYTFAFLDFDENGLIQQKEYRTKENHAASNSLGTSWTRWVREPNVITKYYYDPNGHAPSKLYGGLRETRNADGRVVEELKVTHDGRPWPVAAPLTRFEWDRGAISVIRHYGRQAEPAELLGISTEMVSRDESQQITAWNCYDAKGKPVDAFAFRVIRFPVAQAKSPPQGDVMTSAEALRQAARVRSEIGAGKLTFNRAYRKYDPVAQRHGWQSPYERRAARGALLATWRGVIETLAVGEVSPPQDFGSQIVLIERTR